jgi:ribosomal protein S12 methylthiotransferase
MQGLEIVRDPEDADVAVVNTCGFIDSAKEESIQTILEVGRLKTEGELRGLVVVGCLSQRYGDELRRDIPEVDAVLGITDYSRVPQLLDHLARGGDARWVNDTKGGHLAGGAEGAAAQLAQELATETGGELKTADSDLTRMRLTPSSFSYLRIGEGCDHTCTFCAIPSIRGKQRSKPIATLVAEAETLAATGVRELVLVAEDSTAYGMDQERKRLLPQLLDALSEVDGIEWIRVLYAYPHTVRPELTERLRDNPKVVPYIDIPIQHISTPMLQAMKRGVSKEQVMRILDRLRDEVPGIAVRSTYIVGFPGETDQDFEELLELTRDYRFERLGVFPYSHEEGTPAYELQGAVPEDVVAERIRQIMELSKQNIEARNASLVGQTMRLIVDHEHPDPASVGLSGPAVVARSFADAPEIDCSVHLLGSHRSGEFVEARITGVAEYDLLAEPQ